MEATAITSTAAPPAIRRRDAPAAAKHQRKDRKVNVTSIRPRRILNNQSQVQQEGLSATVELVDLTKVENFEDERHIPVVPAPNFDDSNGD